MTYLKWLQLLQLYLNVTAINIHLWPVQQPFTHTHTSHTHTHHTHTPHTHTHTHTPKYLYVNMVLNNVCIACPLKMMTARYMLQMMSSSEASLLNLRVKMEIFLLKLFVAWNSNLVPLIAMWALYKHSPTRSWLQSNKIHTQSHIFCHIKGKNCS